MSSNTFKISTLAAFIMAATNANAALYQIVEVDAPALSVEVNAPQVHGSYGSAIQSSGSDASCFTTDCGSGSGYNLAGDTREATEGFSYRQEVPFGVDNNFIYNDQSDLESYCNSQLKYSTCDSWANRAWFGIESSNIGGLYRERNAWNIASDYPSNASGFIQSTTAITTPDSAEDPNGGANTPTSGTKNVVVNAFDGSKVLGNTNSGYYTLGNTTNALMYRNRGFYDSTHLLPRQTSDGADAIVEKMGRSMAFDSFEYGGNKYVVGSAAVAPYDYTDSNKDVLGDVGNCIGYSDPAANKECQSFAFALKPFVWDVTGLGATATGLPVSLWDGIGNSDGDDTKDTANKDNAAAIGGVRAAVVPTSGTYTGNPVLVGLNTYKYSDNLLMQAAVFYPKSGFSAVSEHAWETTFIADATVRIGSDYIYSNSVAKDINNNLLVIGEAKRRGDKPENGSANNRLFIADASAGAPTASYFSGGIFFSGAGGEANAINNYNEIVGQIDAEDNREISGKERRRRAFIYPYNGTGSETSRRAVFNNKAWLIDNLTNGGAYSTANNHFRVINASDINDAGVISATALKCSVGEYDSTSHNAYCGGGTSSEEIVAVKLIPINNATSDDISERSEAETVVKRSGAGFGLLSLTMLVLISFRRRK